MSEAYTTSNWTPKAGEQDDFVEAWREFADWTSQMPGVGALTLMRDDDDHGRFVSIGQWRDLEAAHAWKSSPEFSERIGRVQEYVAEFVPRELEVIATVSEPAVATR